MSIRTLHSHVLPDSQEHVTITVLDEPGAGGAHYHYKIEPQGSDGLGTINPADIRFQKGPIGEAGVNGVTQEALLAVVIDRLRSFQSGPFPCPENELALFHAEHALASLLARTKARQARGVEGKTAA